MNYSNLHKRITVNPKVLSGKPTIRNSRISVDLILRMLTTGIKEEEIINEYPFLEQEDIRAALLYPKFITYK